MDELAGIRRFVRVVEGGSFVAAARRLGLSKSVITKRVRDLEELLKAQLLVRSTRRLTLTDAGASYFERCVRIVAELDEAQSVVRSLTVGLTGTLRISCIASFLAHQLARDVCRFQQQHPDLVVELHQTTESTIRSRRATMSAFNLPMLAGKGSFASRECRYGDCWWPRPVISCGTDGRAIRTIWSRTAARTTTTFCRSPTSPSPAPTASCGFHRSGRSCCLTASG